MGEFFMLAIPSGLQAKCEEYLRDKATPNSLQGVYKKWPPYGTGASLS